MFQSTTGENFQSWDKFLDAYYEPIRSALGLIPFIGEARADDIAQSFFLKLYERDFLENRPTITGRFRNWLYVAARRHAVDEMRKLQRCREHPYSFDAQEPADQHGADSADPAFDSDEMYALSILHMTVRRVHEQLVKEGKSDHWMIFDELVLSPMIPGRVPKTREELLSMFPGQDPVFLDNRVTTVKRVFRRVLPALIPVDPAQRMSSEEQFQELLSILSASKTSRLWLAFLTSPRLGAEESFSSSLDLAARLSSQKTCDEVSSPDIQRDELRVLLGFWLDMPLHEYLEDLEGVGPGLATAIHNSRPTGRHGVPRDRTSSINLRRLIAGKDPVISKISQSELKILFERLKLFAKRVHRSAKRGSTSGTVRGTARRESSMPIEVAQVLYNLAGALALTRCGVRIIGLADDRYRANVAWLLEQPWLDIKLRSVFVAALRQLDDPCGS